MRIHSLGRALSGELNVLRQAESWLHELEDVLSREGERPRSLTFMEDIKGCILSLLL